MPIMACTTRACAPERRLAMSMDGPPRLIPTFAELYNRRPAWARAGYRTLERPKLQSALAVVLRPREQVERHCHENGCASRSGG
jgi:hypothetical protein